jgi:hypothetical protein
MLGIVHENIAFPLLWLMLDRKGNSNTSERIELFERFFQFFGEHQVDFLAADANLLAVTGFAIFSSMLLTNSGFGSRPTPRLGLASVRLKRACYLPISRLERPKFCRANAQYGGIHSMSVQPAYKTTRCG